MYLRSSFGVLKEQLTVFDRSENLVVRLIGISTCTDESLVQTKFMQSPHCQTVAMSLLQKEQKGSKRADLL